MIPFASQRGGGQDLATHLRNEHDNEYMEVADLRGAVADDLHGAFAEWEAQASAMTKCANYLYSLSINPDPAQGPMPRDLYDDYITRVEEALGLDGQPRAVVFHIKEDQQGVGREHCHVVWSRIDVQEMKAIQMSFDHDKLMTVTRQFARDHDIELAPGYHKLEDRKRQTYRQLSLYEKARLESTGFSLQERRDLITELWHGRDTPDSFVKALEYHGYVLATGRRPYVLVDIHGDTHSLPKLIDHKAANTKAIRAFLGADYVSDNLPSVENAKELAIAYRKTLVAFKQSEKRADKTDELKEHQAKRRVKLDRKIAAFLDRQKYERLALEGRHRVERDTHRSGYLDQTRDIKLDRHENKPRGLAGFLAKVTGVEQVRHKVHRYQDRKRYDAFLDEKHETRDRQDEEQKTQRRGQEMQALDMERKRRALDHTEKRELQSLKTSFEKQQAIRYRSGHEHMPSLRLELTPPGRKAVPHKAKNRFTSEVGRVLWPAKKIRTRDPGARENTVHEQFGRAAQGGRDWEAGASGTTALPPKPRPSLDEKDQTQDRRERLPDPKARDSIREGHIDRALQAFDRKHESTDQAKQPSSQEQPPERLGREYKVDQPIDKLRPGLESGSGVLQQEFGAAASGQPDPEITTGGSSNQTTSEPSQPTREFVPKPPDNEPDRER